MSKYGNYKNYCNDVKLTLELFEDKSIEFQIAICIDRLREKFNGLNYFDAHDIVISCMKDINEQIGDNIR